MLSWGTLKEFVANIGLPSTVVIAVIIAVQIGWMPIETETSRAYTAAVLAAKTSQDNAAIAERMLGQHDDQRMDNARSLEHLLAALREVCFNTANNRERQRACGAIVTDRHDSRW